MQKSIDKENHWNSLCFHHCNTPCVPSQRPFLVFTNYFRVHWVKGAMIHVDCNSISETGFPLNLHKCYMLKLALNRSNELKVVHKHKSRTLPRFYIKFWMFTFDTSYTASISVPKSNRTSTHAFKLYVYYLIKQYVFS